MGAGQPRRRMSERFVHDGKVRLQAESWPEPLALST
jgi:hypothetical protein